MQQTVELTAGPWRVIFRKCGDRYAHELSLILPEGSVALLESVEGTDSDDWPPSPPLQQLHVEPRPQGPVALLVGMAGTSHWSLSCSADTRTGQLELDIACRVHRAPVWLGSTYRLVERGAAELWRPEGLLWQGQHYHCRRELEALTESGPDAVTVRPALPTGPLPQTIRWKYTLS